MPLVKHGLVAAAALGLSGCAALLGGILDGAENAAGQQIGQSLVAGYAPAPQARPGPAVQGGGFGMYQPQLAYVYTQMLFQMAFAAGGYDLGEASFKPGEYVVWSFKGGGEPAGSLERAYLGDDAKGNRWWRVKMIPSEAGQEPTTLEGLFSRDMTRLLRLRGKFPGDKTGNELPVDDQSYYVAPRHLSAESVQAATKGIENVTVPAGTFSARHVVYGSPEGTVDWWLSDKVPGGLVRETSGGRTDDERGGLELVKFGRDAKTELASF